MAKKINNIWDIVDIRSNINEGLLRFKDKYQDAVGGSNPEGEWQAIISSSIDATVYTIVKIFGDRVEISVKKKMKLILQISILFQKRVFL